MIDDMPGTDFGPNGETPYGLMLAVVVVAIDTAFIGEHGEAILEAISGQFTTTGLLILAVTLLLTRQILSTDRSDLLWGLFTPEGICGVVIFVIIVLFLAYNHGSLFGGRGDDGGDE